MEKTEKNELTKEMKIKLLKEQFVEVLYNTCNVTIATKVVGISKSTAYNYRRQDEEFAKRWDEAIATSIDTIDGEAMQRGVFGENKKIYRNEKIIGTERRCSDKILCQLLSFSHRKKLKEMDEKAKNKNEYENAEEEEDPAQQLHEFLKGIREKYE